MKALSKRTVTCDYKDCLKIGKISSTALTLILRGTSGEGGRGPTTHGFQIMVEGAQRMRAPGSTKPFFEKIPFFKTTLLNVTRDR